MIPADFDGFSIEVDDAANKYLGVASSPNLVFYQLLRNLGRATIRIGGSSTDYSCWEPSRAPYPQGCQFMITPAAVNGYFKASALTGWPLIVGVNLAQNDAIWALHYGKEVARVARSFPASTLLGFEFGNEPDLYSSETLFGNHLIRPQGYSWPNLVSNWDPYVRAFRSNHETAAIPLVGPAYDDSSDVWRNAYLGPFLDGVGTSNLGIATVHEYPTDTCGTDTVTIPQLLAQSLIASYTTMAAGWVSTTSRRGLPLEIGETNSTACGGKHGVDDVFAATVWGLDWLFTNVNLGMRRINFHMDTAAYSAVHVVPTTHPDGTVSYANTVEPLYYAMYTFSHDAQGSHVLPTTVSTSANVKAYAVSACATCAVKVFVINKDLRASGPVVVHPSTAMGRASLLVVQAPSLRSNAVMYGGQSFDNATGLIGTPQTTSILPDANGNYVFNLANASAIVLTINPHGS